MGIAHHFQINNKKTIGLTPVSDYYLRLINEFPPRPINNKDELIATQKRINFILDKTNITQDDQDYLNILGMLVYNYEEKYEQLPELKPQEILQSLIDEGAEIRELLHIFISESILFDILNNRRETTIEECEKLKDYAFRFFHSYY